GDLVARASRRRLRRAVPRGRSRAGHEAVPRECRRAPLDRGVLRDAKADRRDLSRRARSRAREASRRHQRAPRHEDEVREELASPDDFVRGPRVLAKRGTRDDDAHAFVVEDGRYVSGRWPGDAYLIAKKLAERLPAALTT